MKVHAPFAKACAPTSHYSDGFSSTLPPQQDMGYIPQSPKPRFRITLPKFHFKKKFIAIFVLFVLLVAFGFTAISFFGYKTGGVQLTNLTSRSASISWVTPTQSKGMVVVTDSNVVLPFTIAGLGGQTFYDDRDVVEARLKSSLSATVPTDDVSVTEFGSYYVHHVTLTNLVPEHQYRFWIGDGSVFVNVKFAENGNDYFTTLSDLSEILNPVPSYGYIKAVYSDEYSGLEDGVVYIQLRDEISDQLSSLISTPVSENGDWYLDLANLRSKSGEKFFTTDNEKKFNPRYELIIESGPLGNWKTTFQNISELSPAKTVIINVSGDTGADDTLKYNGVTSFFDFQTLNLSSIAFRSSAKAIDDCYKTTDCGSGYACKSGNCVKLTTPAADKCAGKTCGCGTLPACPKPDDGFKNPTCKTDPTLCKDYKQGKDAGSKCTGDACEDGGKCGDLNALPCFCKSAGYEIYPGDTCSKTAKKFSGYATGVPESELPQCNSKTTEKGGCVSNSGGGKQCLSDFGKVSGDLKCVDQGGIGRWISTKVDPNLIDCNNGYFVDKSKGQTVADCPNTVENPCKGLANNSTPTVGGVKVVCCGGVATNKVCDDLPVTTDACADKADGPYSSGGSFGYYCCKGKASATACSTIAVPKQVECTGYDKDGKTVKFTLDAKYTDCNSDPRSIKPVTPILADECETQIGQSCHGACGSSVGSWQEGKIAKVNGKCVCQSTGTYTFNYCGVGKALENPVIGSKTEDGKMVKCFFDHCWCWPNNQDPSSGMSISNGQYCTYKPNNEPKQACESQRGCYAKVVSGRYVDGAYSYDSSTNTCTCKEINTVVEGSAEDCSTAQKTVCKDQLGDTNAICNKSTQTFLCVSKTKDSFKSFTNNQLSIAKSQGEQCPKGAKDCSCWHNPLLYSTISGGDYCYVETSVIKDVEYCINGAFDPNPEGSPCGYDGMKSNSKICVKEKNKYVCKAKTAANTTSTSQSFAFSSYAKTEATTLVISPSEGYYVLPGKGLYCTEYKGEKYCYKSGESGAVKFYIDTNNNSTFDEGVDVDFASDSLKLEVSQVSISSTYDIQSGFNIISFTTVPEDGALVASELLNYLNAQYSDSFYSIARFDGSKWIAVENRNGTQYSSTDFNIIPGQGYLLKSKRNLKIEIVGLEVTSPMPISFNPGWNLIGINGATKTYTAESLLDAINANTSPVFQAVNVTQWPADKQKYEGIQKEKDKEGVMQVYGFDFPIDNKAGYFVRINSGSGTWTPQ